MTQPIALQLYTVRDALKADFEGTIARVAEIGYIGVETAGLFHLTPHQASELFTRYGLFVVGAHVPLPIGDARQEVLDTVAALGCKYIVCPFLPPEEFRTRDLIRQNCERLNEANAAARDAGYTFLYHNHWWEFTLTDGWYPYQVMLEYLDPTVQFELDAYWVQTGGCDPVPVLAELEDRVRLMHVKDGPVDRNAPMLAVGEGAMRYRPIIEASKGAVEWLIVELDRSATDMMTAVASSYQYLINEGLARGNKS